MERHFMFFPYHARFLLRWPDWAKCYGKAHSLATAGDQGGKPTRLKRTAFNPMDGEGNQVYARL